MVCHTLRIHNLLTLRFLQKTLKMLRSKTTIMPSYSGIKQVLDSSNRAIPVGNPPSISFKSRFYNW